ncbi:peptidoglycan DD-metalloendopeptidase family protein [Streptomyces sp. NPDC048603]|uniref:peptidoglycan DD-metalloendopeptidase family protein n=1 Tax=Streptomyces sp. NPDC048603 TaxID=3365577 RepID=UPI0037144D06
MNVKRGLLLLAVLIAGSPLALGLGLILLIGASEDDKSDPGFDDRYDLVAGTLRVGPGYVPAKYAGLIQKAAAACDQGLSAGVLAAQIEAESSFNPNAISYEDPITKTRPIAYGISQFIPSTWRVEGLDGDGDGDKDVMDPADAIPSQGNMMCKLLRTAKKYPHYNGSPIELALAGYNSGWGWVDYYKGVPPPRFAQGQTYNYVKSIMKGVARLTAPDTSGQPPMYGQWSKPVNARIGTGYRVPGGMWSSGYHTGIDFPVGTGTPVHAIGPAVVVSAGSAGAYGNEVVLRHADGMYSQYAHLSRLDVRAGQQVQGGQAIGLSGNTGNSSGPHLHMEVRTGPAYGSDVSPVTYMRSKGIQI